MSLGQNSTTILEEQPSLMVQVCNWHLTDKLAEQCPRHLVRIVEPSMRIDPALPEGAAWQTRYVFASTAAMLAFLAISSGVDVEVLPKFGDDYVTRTEFFALTHNPTVASAIERWSEEPDEEHFEWLVMMLELAK